MDLIDRQAAMNAFAERVKRSNNSDFAPTPTWNDAVDIVENLPSVDAEPVRHVHWIESDTDGFVCSVCRNGYRNQPTLMGKPMFEYCPVCGARMDGEQNDTN